MGDETAAAKRCIVRNFLPTDLAFVAQIAGTSAEASRWTPDSYAPFAATQGCLLLVADSGSGVSGFLAARWAGGEAEILNLAVRTDARRSGIGTELVRAALGCFEQRQLNSVYLEVRASNAGAIALYNKHGLWVAYRRKGYYHDPQEDAVCMMKKLTDCAN